jgi:OOP family OmpA-OmpF porin
MNEDEIDGTQPAPGKITNMTSQEGPSMLRETTAVLFAATLTQGAVNADGYLRDSEGDIVKNDYGDCVHTDTWQASDAVAGCDSEVPAAVSRKTVQLVVVETEQPVVMEASFDARTLFAFDTAQLRPGAQARLDRLLARMDGQHDLVKMHIAGHADPIGDPAYNKHLAMQRAKAVGQYLIRRGDLEPQRLAVVSHGETDPVVRCPRAEREALIECLAPNRRVEVEIETVAVL